LFTPNVDYSQHRFLFTQGVNKTKCKQNFNKHKFLSTLYVKKSNLYI